MFLRSLAPPAFALVLAMPLIAAGQPAMAQDMDDNRIIADVKDAYRAISDRPQEITAQFRTVTRTGDGPDVEAAGTMTVLQQGENMRGEIAIESVMTMSSDGSAKQEPPRPTVFVQDEDTLHVMHAGDDDPSDAAFYVEESELSDGLAAQMMGPHATLALFDAMVAVPVVAREEYYEGMVVHTLRSSEPFAVGHAMADAKFWINQDTHLVEHMDVYLLDQGSDGDGPASSVHVIATIDHRMDVDIPDGTFDIEIGSDAENFSDDLAQIGREQMGGNQ